MAQLPTCFLLVLLSLLVACQASESEVAITESRPNIIYILADDLGYGDLSCYGQTHFSTPNIDRLAAQGMLLRQHYSGAPVCAPARSVLMTGQHTGHTPVRGNAEVLPEGQEPLPASAKLLPEYLQAAGYQTAGFGKWGLGYPGSEGAPENQGFDYFFGYNCQREAHLYYPTHLWRNDEMVALLDNHGGYQRNTYAPDLIQEEVLDYIRDQQDAPFFLYYAHTVPHAELQAPEHYMEKYRGQYLPEKAFEGWNPPEYRGKFGYSSQPEGHAAFAAMINLLDDHVGQVLDVLDELSLTDNTLVVFTSDNGPHLEGGADPDYFDSNGPLRGYKRDLYEGGIRVPFIAAWPGHIPAASESDVVSGFQDMLPTFLTSAGVAPPTEIDGINLLPALEGDSSFKGHEVLYWEFSEQGGRVAIRQGDWKAIRYQLQTGEGEWELYNLAEDIGETTNLATTEAERLTELVDLIPELHVDSPRFPLVGL